MLLLQLYINIHTNTQPRALTNTEARVASEHSYMNVCARPQLNSTDIYSTAVFLSVTCEPVFGDNFHIVTITQR